MKLFDLLKKTKPATTTKTNQHKGSTVLTTEKVSSQPQHSAIQHPSVVHEGTPFERKIVTFEERKRTAIPSEHGLYPAEILLLEYCSKGTYPNPKSGYPGFWWFEYGIQDVDGMLLSLKKRGFIEFDSINNSIKALTVAQLKEILTENNLSTAGKKAELVERIANTISTEALIKAGVQQKYALTELGSLELSNNAYVPYMHKTKNKTTEEKRFGMEFNVWSINRILGTTHIKDWETIVKAQEARRQTEIAKRNEESDRLLKEIDPDLYKEQKIIDRQIAVIQEADILYQQEKDLDWYITFWESVWKNGGLKFEGSKWHFELADLYIKAKRYDDALLFVQNLKKRKPDYETKADKYIERISKLKAKHKA